MTDPRCGTAYGYTIHVADGTPKCAACRRAHADSNRAYENRRYLNRGPLLIDATGTRRRIQALALRGWSTSDIGRRLGVSGAAVRQWAARPRVKRSTAVRIADLYDEWWDQFGPSAASQRYARKRGWAPSLAFDDDQIDDPAARPAHNVHGHEHGHPRNPDLEDRVLVLTRAGLSAAEIAVRLRTNKRYVQRVRARYRSEGDAA